MDRFKEIKEQEKERIKYRIKKKRQTESNQSQFARSEQAAKLKLSGKF